MAGNRHFDWIAPLYERFSSRKPRTELVQFCGLPVPGRLLDAAGGTGSVAASMVGLAQQVVVADASLGMLHQARRKPELHVVASMAELLPFPAGCFDRVLMVDAFHHLADQRAGIRELWRVLAPGGRLLIAEPDIRQCAVRLVALVEKLLLMRSHFVPAEGIADALASLGAQPSVGRQGHTVLVVAQKPSASALAPRSSLGSV